jgi:hypothetical protein
VVVLTEIQSQNLGQPVAVEQGASRNAANHLVVLPQLRIFDQILSGGDGANITDRYPTVVVTNPPLAVGELGQERGEGGIRAGHRKPRQQRIS